MRKMIIILQIMTIIFLLSIPEQANTDKFYIMNVTFYSLHEDCISDEHNDGFTAIGTKIRVGVCAINVDLINGKWVVISPLKLGDKILIEGLGEFIVEDTGRFAERDARQDIWTVDIYMESYEDAVKGGKQLRKVFVIND